MVEREAKRKPPIGRASPAAHSRIYSGMLRLPETAFAEDRGAMIVRGAASVTAKSVAALAGRLWAIFSFPLRLHTGPTLLFWGRATN